MATNEATVLDPLWTELPDGFHPGVEMNDYLGWRRVSSSVIGSVRPDRSMAWVRHAIEGGNGGEDTAARVLGSVTHTAVFEPDLLDSCYVVEPLPDPAVFTTDDGKPASNVRSTKKWKAMIAELEKGGKKVVGAEAMRTAKALRDAVLRHKRASQLLQFEAGPVELSATCSLDVDGIPVPVKIRPDKLHTRAGVNVNLKTAKNAHPNAFQWDAWKFGYFIGAEFYGRVLTDLGWDFKRTVFIVVQTEGPAEVATYEPDFGTVSASEDQVRYRLRRIARCIESGAWCGLSENIEPLSLPHPAWERIAEETSADV